MPFLNKEELKQAKCKHEFVVSLFEFDKLICHKCDSWFNSTGLNEYIASLRQQIAEMEEGLDNCLATIDGYREGIPF